MPKGIRGRAICEVGDCDKVAHARGWCDSHAKAIQRGTFDPVTGEDRRRPRGRSFENRLAASIEVGDCWEWRLYRFSEKGYGQVRLPDRLMLAHRWVWENLVGPIPPGLDLDHLCRNRPCVNPDHLEPVTHQVNLQRGSHDFTQGPCIRGHDHAYRHRAPGGQTYCRACRVKDPTTLDIRPIR